MNYKKLISLLLSLVMMFTLLPVSAFAEGAEDVYKFYSSTDKATWTELTIGAQPMPFSNNIDIAVGKTVYIKASLNSADLDDSATLHQIYQGIEGDVTVESEGGYIKITGVSAGRARLDVRKNEGAPVLAMLMFNVIADSIPSDYASATVKQVNADSGKAEMATVSGTLTSGADKGFSVEADKLYFDTTGKTAGVYDAVVGGKQYTAVIFPSTAVSSFAARELPVKAVEYKLSDLPVEDNGFAVTSLTTEGNIVSSEANNAAVPIYNGEIVPIYLYKVENSAVVSMADSTVYITGQYKEFWDIEKVNVSETAGTEVIAYKITPKNVKATSAIFSPVNIVENGTITKSFHIIYSSYFGTTINNTAYGFTNNIEKFKENAAGYAVVKSIDAEYVQGQGATDSLTFYFTKWTSATEADYVLYDEIDISSIKVSASDNTNIKIDKFVTSADGDNAIGFTLSLNDSAPKTEELLIEFKLKDSTEHKVYSGVTWIPQKTAGQTVTVDNSGDFLESYYNPEVTEITLKGGDYYFDFNHIRVSGDIVIKGAEGEQVVFYGDKNSASPVITIDADNHGQLSNIIIDGSNKAKTGIYAKYGSHVYANNLIIRNCAVGIQSDAVMQYIQADNTRFIGNKIGMIIGPAEGRVTNCEFTGNDIAILHRALGIPAFASKIKNNIFIDNTTDLQSETEAKISITQNYFDKIAEGAVPAIKGEVYGTGTAVNEAVYYSPYYIDEAKTTLAADLAGAEPIAARTTATSYTMPVDLTVNEATKFNNDLFSEMKSATGTVAVQLPVTEKVTTGDTTETKVTTIWGFDNGENGIAATLPAGGMDLKVTDVPTEEAKTIVTNTVENTADIVQYVNFKHDGTLPGKATVKVLASTVSSATDLKLFYINESTGAVEEAEICAVETVEIDDETYYVVTVDHCSEYIITTNVIAKDNTSEGGTGDSETDNNTGTGGSGSSSGSSSGTTSTPSTTGTQSSTSSKAPVTSTANDFVSAVEIEDKLEASTGNEIEVDVSDKNFVSPKAFTLLAEYTDKTLVFEGEDYAISFASSDLTDPDLLGNKTFDASVNETSPDLADIKAAAGEDADIKVISFAHNGQLPGKATVKVNVGTDLAGTAQNVYIYNADGTFTAVGTATVNENGNIEFTTDYLGEFVVTDSVLADDETQTEQPTDKTEEPDKSDDVVTEPAEKQLPVMPIIAVVVAIIGVVVFFLKKKK